MIGIAHLERPIPELRSPLAHSFSMAEKIGLPAPRLGAGGVVHEFNNLLAVVPGNLDLLRRGLSDDPKIARLLDGAIQAYSGERSDPTYVGFGPPQDLRTDDQRRGRSRAYRLRDG
jgi:hypothetical protein